MIQQASPVKPQIEFSQAATDHILSYLKKSTGQTAVRLSVKKTGCSGLSYVVDYVQAPMEGDLMMPLIDEVLVYIDKGSYPFLKDMHVDYVKQGLNHKLVFSNPNQTGQCGCGESFTVG